MTPEESEMQQTTGGAAHVGERHRGDHLLFRIASFALTELCGSIWDTTMDICDEYDIPPLGGTKEENTP
jgi:hypothetical protein